MLQDPVNVAPQNYKVLFENNRIRLIEYASKPGDKTPMHSHPAYLVYILNPGKAKFTFPDGKTKERETRPGEVVWSEAVTHIEENTGTTDIRALIIELKEE
jgi:quercetin dioxygenase-like cupin family protein